MATQPLQIDRETTREDLEGSFLAASNYDNPTDVQKARNYVSAGRAILTLPIAEVDQAGERVRVEPRLIQEGIAKAERWLAVQTITSAKPINYAIPCDWRDG